LRAPISAADHADAHRPPGSSEASPTKSAGAERVSAVCLSGPAHTTDALQRGKQNVGDPTHTPDGTTPMIRRRALTKRPAGRRLDRSFGPTTHRRLVKRAYGVRRASIVQELGLPLRS
jgi:hypothetical protein